MMFNSKISINVLILLFLVSGSVYADTIEYYFSGIITKIHDPNNILSSVDITPGGSTFSGSFRYDPSSPDIPVRKLITTYPSGNITFAIDNKYRFAAESSTIAIHNNEQIWKDRFSSVWSPDELSGIPKQAAIFSKYDAPQGDRTRNVQIELQDSTSTVFSDRSLPTKLKLTNFDKSTISISAFNTDRTFYSIVGNITSLVENHDISTSTLLSKKIETNTSEKIVNKKVLNKQRISKPVTRKGELNYRGLKSTIQYCIGISNPIEKVGPTFSEKSIAKSHFSININTMRGQQEVKGEALFSQDVSGEWYLTDYSDEGGYLTRSCKKRLPLTVKIYDTDLNAQIPGMINDLKKKNYEAIFRKTAPPRALRELEKARKDVRKKYFERFASEEDFGMDSLLNILEYIQGKVLYVDNNKYIYDLRKMKGKRDNTIIFIYHEENNRFYIKGLYL